MTTSHPNGAREITRRKFITGFVALTAVVARMVTGQLGRPALDLAVTEDSPGQSAEGWVTLGPLTALRPGIPQGFPFARRLKNGWVESRQTGIAYAVTHNHEDVQVFANVCTHGGCRVTWAPEKGAFVCPCHAGRFAPDGRVSAGPPARPLERLSSRILAGQVQVHLQT